MPTILIEHSELIHTSNVIILQRKNKVMVLYDEFDTGQKNLNGSRISGPKTFGK